MMNIVGLDGQGTVIKAPAIDKPNLYRTGSVNMPHARTIVRNPFAAGHFKKQDRLRS